MAVRPEDRWYESNPAQISILGLHVARRDTDAALDELTHLHDRPGAASCFFVNVHSVNEAIHDEDYAQALHRADLVLNDGVGVELAAKVRGRSFPTNLNGTDLTPRLLEIAEQRGWSVYLLGSTAPVVERAAARIKVALPGLRIVGRHHGYVKPLDPGVMADLDRLRPDLLLVGMGNPLQELFIDALMARPGCPVRLSVAVGAFLDFAAGEVSRAPRWVRSLRLEWVWRMVQEPGRLWRRYLLGNWLFVGRIIFDRWNLPPAWEPQEAPTLQHLVGEPIDLTAYIPQPVVRRAGERQTVGS